MSCFICERCDEFFDSNFSICYEDPDKDTALICEDCHERLEMDKEISECDENNI